MSDEYKIFIDRLHEGGVQKIKEDLSSSFLEIEEKELSFKDPVSVRGEAYLTDDHLIIRLKAATFATMPCSICNEMTKTPLFADNFYHTMPLEELSSPIFDYREPLREDLLLELPKYAECNGGHCPKRKELSSYLKNPSNPQQDPTTYLPFADLDQEEKENQGD